MEVASAAANALYHAVTFPAHCHQLSLHTVKLPEGFRAGRNALHKAVMAFDQEVELELTAQLQAIACLVWLCAAELASRGHEIWKIGNSSPAFDAASRNGSIQVAVESVVRACKVCNSVT